MFVHTHTVNEVNAKDLNRVASNITQNNESNVVKIRGLPWDVDKKYIMDLFPSNKWSYSLQLKRC